MLIDSHCHLLHCYENLDRELIEKIEKEFLYILNISINLEEIERLLNDNIKYSKKILNAIGIYPEKARFFNEKMKQEFLLLFEKINPVAIGEIGLDFHWDYGDVKTQEKLFRFQIELAIEKKLPFVVHSREAFEDTFRILSSYKFERPFLLHCFGYGKKEAEKFLSINNCYFSFAGNITYPKADELRNALKIIPLDRILLETDAPYLSPMPQRGKRNNPFYIKHTYSFLASLIELNLEEFEKRIEENFRRIFGL